MRDRSWSFLSLAPYAIFPLPAEDVADLLLGFIDLAMSLYLGLLEESLTRADIDVQIARRPEAGGLFLEATRGVGIRVPPHVLEQMMVELMTPDKMHADEQSPEEALGSRVVTFEDETSAWEPTATA